MRNPLKVGKQFKLSWETTDVLRMRDPLRIRKHLYCRKNYGFEVT